MKLLYLLYLLIFFRQGSSLCNRSSIYIINHHDNEKRGRKTRKLAIMILLNKRPWFPGKQKIYNYYSTHQLRPNFWHRANKHNFNLSAMYWWSWNVQCSINYWVFIGTVYIKQWWGSALDPRSINKVASLVRSTGPVIFVV